MNRLQGADDRLPAQVRLQHCRPLLCAAVAMAMATGQVLAADAGPSAATPDGADAAASGSLDASFDRSLLSGAGNNTTDLSRFEHGNVVLPGVYNLDVYLNRSWVGRKDVRFAAPSPQASATPCLDNALFAQLALPTSRFAGLETKLADPTVCVDIAQLIPDAKMSFDMGNLRLDVSVPQAYMGHAPRGYVAPEYWDEGVVAGLLNYNLNSYRSRAQGRTQTNSYLGLNAGLNLGAWHLRQDSTVSWQASSGDGTSRRH